MNNNTNDSNLQIYQKYLELLYYSIDIVRKYPKSEKYALAQETKRSVYAGLNCIVHAMKLFTKQEKLKYLTELDVNLTVLKVQVRIAYKDKFISMQNYTAWSEKITEVCNMLGGWIKSLTKK